LEVTAHVNDAGLCVPLRVPMKFKVSRPSPEADMADYPCEHNSGTCDLLISELVRHVTRGTDNLHANFGASVTFLVELWRKTDNATL